MIQTTRPPIRVGIAGLGRAGLETHCGELALYPHLFNVVAVCDPIKERRDLAAARCPGCRVYRKLDTLLGDSSVELVDIATRTEDHLAHAVQALKTDRWVLVENPLCCDFEQAQMLRAAAVKYGNRLMVRNPYRCEAAFQQVKEVIDSAVLGDVYCVRMRWGRYERRDDWQVLKRCGGGAELAQGVAFIELALELLKTPPVKVWADFKRVVSVGDAEDYFHILMRNFAGLTVDLEVSGGRIGVEPLFVVSGSRGEYRVMPDAGEATLRYLDPGTPLERKRSSVRTPPLGSQSAPDEFRWVDSTLPLSRDAREGLARVWEHVFYTVRENRPYPVSLESAVEPLRLLALVKKDSPF